MLNVSGDITYLVFKSTSKDHMIKGSCNFIVRVSPEIQHPSKSDERIHCSSGVIAAEEQDLTSSLNSAITTFSKAPEISCSQIQNFVFK